MTRLSQGKSTFEFTLKAQTHKPLMAGARIKIEVDDAEVRSALQRLAHAAANPAQALAEIGEELLKSTRARFSSKTGPDGETWADNTETTIARKGRNNPLYASGMLQGQMRWQMAGGTAVEVGTNRIYGAVQQFGNPNNRFYNTPSGRPAPIPARPYLGISSEDRAEILDILREYLAQSIA